MRATYCRRPRSVVRIFPSPHQLSSIIKRTWQGATTTKTGAHDGAELLLLGMNCRSNDFVQARQHDISLPTAVLPRRLSDGQNETGVVLASGGYK
mmetsp:Transcript_45319/g.67322  ORF Transcript_45319/g.67322 Transcript_45319/m.67322 type:complete len:95 (+) Transcript_45319:482-766(+)